MNVLPQLKLFFYAGVQVVVRSSHDSKRTQLSVKVYRGMTAVEVRPWVLGWSWVRIGFGVGLELDRGRARGRARVSSSRRPLCRFSSMRTRRGAAQ